MPLGWPMALVTALMVMMPAPHVKEMVAIHFLPVTVARMEVVAREVAAARVMAAGADGGQGLEGGIVVAMTVAVEQVVVTSGVAGERPPGRHEAFAQSELHP